MKKILVISSLVAGTALAQAQAQDHGSAFFQASLTPDIAVQSRTTGIDGITLNIWGENPQHAFALGFVNGSTGDSAGFTWSFFCNYADNYTGVAWSLVNYTKGDFVGWQSGLVNYAQEFHGLQWGFVNYTENLRGVQLGLINVAMNNPWFNEFPNKLATGFPFLNWSF